MKKAVKIFAVLFLISIISTTVFGAAAGAQAIKHFAFDGDYNLGSLINKFRGYKNINFNPDGMTLIKEETVELSLTSLNGLSIEAEAAGVKILPTDSEQASVTYKLYSRNESRKITHTFKAVSESNNIKIDFKTADSHFHQGLFGDCAAVMEIYLPKDIILQSLDLTLDVCDMNIQSDLKSVNAAIDLDASLLEMGGSWTVEGYSEIDLEAASLNIGTFMSGKAKINGEASNIEFGKSSFSDFLNIDLEVSGAQLNLSCENNGYTVTSAVTFGGVSISDDLNARYDGLKTYIIGDGKCSVSVKSEMSGADF